MEMTISASQREAYEALSELGPKLAAELTDPVKNIAASFEFNRDADGGFYGSATLKFSAFWIAQIAELLLYFDWRDRSRLRISTSYPRPVDGGRSDSERREISVSSKRAARAIAGDIERKILPAAIEGWAKQAAANARASEAAGERKRQTLRLANMLGGAGTSYSESRRSSGRVTSDEEITSPVVYLPSELGYGSVKVNYSGASASLDLGSLPIDAVAEMLMALRRWWDVQPAPGAGS
jgi:hypothetical protein